MKAIKVLTLAVMTMGSFAVANVASADNHGGKLTGHAAVSTDYHWRGRSLSGGQPAHFSGGVNYHLSDWGVDVGAWMGQISDSNVSATANNATSDFSFQSNWYLAWNRRVHNDIWVRPQVTWYTFLGGGGAYDDATLKKAGGGGGTSNMIEASLDVTWKWLTVGASWMDEYYGVDTTTTRYFLALEHRCKDTNWTLGANWGYNDFSSPEKLNDRAGAWDVSQTAASNFAFDSYWDLELSATKHFGATDFKVAYWITDREASLQNANIVADSSKNGGDLSDNAWVLTLTRNF
jgi:hypothetical protein